MFEVYFALELVVAILSTNSAVSLREFAGELHRCLPFFLAVLCITDETRFKNILLVILTTNIFTRILVIDWNFFQSCPPHQKANP